MKNLKFRPTMADKMAIRHMRKALPKRDYKRFDDELVKIYEDEKPFIKDRTAQGHMILAAAVLSAFRVLCDDHSAENAQDKLRAQVVSLGARSTFVILKLMCAFSPDVLKMIRNYTVQKVEFVYGSAFEIEVKDTDTGFVFEVHKCAYFDFMRRHCEAHLTTLLCEWDRVWIDALPKYIAFARPTTLAQGGRSCRFEFERKISK